MCRRENRIHLAGSNNKFEPEFAFELYIDLDLDLLQRHWMVTSPEW